MRRSSLALVTCLCAAIAPTHALAAGPVVHIVNAKPDKERGLIKLAKFRGSTTAVAANAILVTTLYDEICTEPCGVAVDVADRPLFFFIRDQHPVSYAFRIDEGDEVTLALKPGRSGLAAGGWILAGFLLLPAAIPMIIAAQAKVSLAPGPPSEGQAFTKVKKAKV